MKEPVRILHLISGLGSGGAEAVIMNMLRNMDRSKVIFDFLVQSDENIYDEELKAYGSRIYKIPSYYCHPIQNRRQLHAFFKSHPEYDTIHLHANALLYVAPLFTAKRAGVRNRIMHSHSTFTYRKELLPLHLLNKHRIRHVATHRFACSAAAGAWMFYDEFTLIHNAIDLETFRFRPEDRLALRQELRIPSTELVLGQVGRLESAKNHRFSLEVLREIIHSGRSATLLLVGSGSLKEEICQYAQELGVEDRIHFLGVRKDVGRCLSVFDLFLFPSLFEGLGISLIEAQANGLPCCCSTAIPEDAVLSGNVSRLPLALGPAAWAERLLSLPLARSDNIATLRAAGFDIREAAIKLQRSYLEMDSCQRA